MSSTDQVLPGRGELPWWWSVGPLPGGLWFPPSWLGADTIARFIGLPTAPVSPPSAAAPAPTVPPVVPTPVDPSSPVDNLPPPGTPQPPADSAPPTPWWAAPFLPAATGTSSEFQRIVSRTRNSRQFEQLVKRAVKTEFERLLEQPVKSKLIREGIKRGGLRVAPIVVAGAGRIGAAVLIGELGALALEVLGRAKQEVADDIRRRLDREVLQKIAERRTAGALGPPTPPNGGTTRSPERVQAPRTKGRPERLPPVPRAFPGAEQRSVPESSIFGERELLPSGYDPTTYRPPAPKRGIGTSPAPLVAGIPPLPATRPAPKKLFALDLRKLRPAPKLRSQRPRVVVSPLTPINVTLPSLPPSAATPTVPGSPPGGFAEPALASPSPAPRTDPRFSPTRAPGGSPPSGCECFVPKKGGRRGQCRQGYFRETASGVTYKTWSRRKCPPS